MRVVLAPGRYAGWLPPVAVAQAMAAGWRDTAADADLVVAPLSDGGVGFVGALHQLSGGALAPVSVTGPMGEPALATMLVVDGPRPTTYLEAAEVAGRDRVAAADLVLATSTGVGELVAQAVLDGAQRVVVGVGGTGVHDGGAGLLAGLVAGLELGQAPRLARGGLALGDVEASDVSALAEVRARLASVELVAATAIDAPLLGLQGASATQAAGKGATPELAQALESRIGHFAHLAAQAVPAARPLAGPGPAAQPGAGAGGGIGFALMLVGARRADGARVVAEESGLGDRLAGADLVVTGERTFDWRSLTGGVVPVAADLALASGVPAVVLAGESLVGRREAMSLGLSGVYALAARPEELDELAQDPVAAIRARAARLARTWSH